ncbi:MAG: fimbrial protein [Vibrio sp.]|uniref:fimbrial protein n=1 Tax=Vibrio sp. TaxID=678 RepID=UPI003A88B0EB
MKLNKNAAIVVNFLCLSVLVFCFSIREASAYNVPSCSKSNVGEFAGPSTDFGPQDNNLAVGNSTIDSLNSWSITPKIFEIRFCPSKNVQGTRCAWSLFNPIQCSGGRVWTIARRYDGTYNWLDSSNSEGGQLGYYMQFSTTNSTYVTAQGSGNKFVVRAPSTSMGTATMYAKIFFNFTRLTNTVNTFNGKFSDAEYYFTDGSGSTSDANWGQLGFMIVNIDNTSGTCNVVDKEVLLPTVNAGEFEQTAYNTDATIRGRTDFYLNITCDHDGAVDVRLSFTDASNVANASDVLSNEDGSADGVGVMIFHPDSGASLVGSDLSISVNGTHSERLEAAYKKTGSARVTSGTVKARSTVALDYN